jgi:Family of unknown function (DUF5329)
MSPRAGPLLAAIVILSCIMALAPAAGMAGPPLAPPAAVAEINFLLAAIGASGCDFYRNGTWYDAQQAQAHLSTKYQWLVARDRIRTTEDFIELAATRSSLSGQAYAVRCAGEGPISSNSWMTKQLRRFRDARGAPRTWRDAPAVQSSN